MGFKNTVKKFRTNSKYRLTLIFILIAIVVALYFLTKNGIIKGVLIGIGALLGIAATGEIAGKDLDLGKLAETGSISESIVNKVDGLWKIDDPKCQKEAINCSNFKTQEEAQETFEYCGGTTDDVFRLDGDKDGKACEALPALKS